MYQAATEPFTFGVERGASRVPILALVLFATTLVAAEATIVATAMPAIVGQVGSMTLYAWAFSAFALTQTALTVVFGKLVDVLGRRFVIVTGVLVFVAGSALAGVANDMFVLIGGRLVQGVGAGAILPATLTIVADLYPPRERGRVQGWLASVWAIAAVGGPVAGAGIVQAFSWRWIFWINLPLGLATAAGFVILLKRDQPRASATIDYLGALLFTLAIACLMIALTVSVAPSPGRLAAFSIGAVMFLGLFIAQERRTPHPNTPVVAGLALTMVMVGWPVGATFAARAFPRLGLRRPLLAGGVLVPFGAVLLVLVGEQASVWLAGAASLVMGLGMGLVSVASLILVQASVGAEQRGGVTASNLFSRNLGATLGASVLGAVQASALGSAKGPSYVHTLAASLHLTFIVLLAIACLSLVFVLLIPKAAFRAVDHA